MTSCQKHIQNAIHHSEKSGFRPCWGWPGVCLGWSNWLQGDLQAARDCGRKAITIQSEAGQAGHALFWHNLLLGTVSLDSGDLPNALDSSNRL